MSENLNHFSKAVEQNSEAWKDITKNEWDKIKQDKQEILSKVSHSELKQKIESKYRELDTKFEASSDYIHTTTSEEISLLKNTFLLDKFWAWEKVSQSMEDLNSIGLDITQLLSGYDSYIESELKDLPAIYKNKIKKAIWLKLSWVSKIISQQKSIARQSNTPFENKKWIINEQITDLLEDVNDKFLPSAKFLVMFDSIEKYKTNPKFSKNTYEMWNTNYHIRLDDKKQQILEMFNAELDENWNFDEWFFSLQTDIIDLSSISWEKIWESLWIDKKEDIILLNEKDKKLEADIMIKYMAFVGTMLLPYAWAITSIPSDLIDTFGSSDWVLTSMQEYGILSPEEMKYEISTSWVETVFWIVWLVWSAFWAQAVSKSAKFVKVFSKLGKLWMNSTDVIKRLWEYMNDFQKVVPNNWKQITKAPETQATSPKNLEAQRTIENSPLIREKLFKQEFNNYIDTLVKNTDSKTVPEKAMIWEKAKELMSQMIQDTDNISTDLLELIGKIKQDITGNLEWMSLRSLTHILESISNSPKIPSNKLIDAKLSKDFPGVNASEYFGFVTVFHDLIKNTLPTQVVEFISENKWWKLSTIKGGQLSSHQYESANNLRQVLESPEGSKIYKAIEEFLASKWLGKDKVPEFVESLAKTIEWHAGNTEFIQVDTARSILNLKNNLLKEFENIPTWDYKKVVWDLLTGMKENKIISESDVTQILSKFEWVSDPKQIQELLQKIFIQKFIKNNIGTDIKIDDINLDELTTLCNTLSTKTAKVQEIQNLLDTWYSQQKIDDIIDGKIKILQENWELINKYLHQTKYENPADESMRFAFNINDIVEYGNPSSEWFTKLIMFNNIWDLVSSPINSSLALLAELKHALNTKPDLVNVEKFTKMYENGIHNMQKLANAYKQKLAQPLSENAPQYIKDLWGNTFWEAYQNAIKLWKPSDEILMFFKKEFKNMCLKLNNQTKEIYTGKINKNTFNADTVRNNFLIKDIEERIDAGIAILKNKYPDFEWFTPKQREWIKEAHNIWKKLFEKYLKQHGLTSEKQLSDVQIREIFNSPEGRIALRQKMKKLAEYDIDPKYADDLIRSWITGWNDIAGKPLSQLEIDMVKLFDSIDTKNLNIDNAKQIQEFITKNKNSLDQWKIQEFRDKIYSLPAEFKKLAKENGTDLWQSLDALKNQETMLQIFWDKKKLAEIFWDTLSDVASKNILEKWQPFLDVLSRISNNLDSWKPINTNLLKQLEVKLTENDSVLPLQLLARYSDNNGWEVRDLLKQRIEKINDIIHWGDEVKNSFKESYTSDELSGIFMTDWHEIAEKIKNIFWMDLNTSQIKMLDNQAVPYLNDVDIDIFDKYWDNIPSSAIAEQLIQFSWRNELWEQIWLTPDQMSQLAQAWIM